MQNAITQVKLEDLKITVGGSGKSLGTAFFGTLTNETNKPISILTLKVDFLDEDRPLYSDHDNMKSLVKSCEILNKVELSLGTFYK